MGSVITCYLITEQKTQPVVLFTLRVQVVEHQVPFGGYLDNKQCEDLLTTMTLACVGDEIFCYGLCNVILEIKFVCDSQSYHNMILYIISNCILYNCASSYRFAGLCFLLHINDLSQHCESKAGKTT